MTRKIRNTKSPEERRAEAETLQASIALQVEQLRNSEAWMKYLDFAGSFHRYSLGNLLLIQAQQPEATRVAGYRAWQAHGRQVRKGEKGLRIFAGRTVTRTEQEQGVGERATGEQTKRERVCFFPVSVFDISQTELIDPDAEDHSTVAHRLAGEDPDGITEAVSGYLTGLGWAVSRHKIPGSINGYTTTDGSRRVAICTSLAPAHAAKTALHEAAHVLLHSQEEAAADVVEHRGVKETEAESVAYVVAGLLGLDTSSYSIGYVAGWSEGETEMIKQTAARVLRAAHTLIDAIIECPAGEVTRQPGVEHT